MTVERMRMCSFRSCSMYVWRTSEGQESRPFKSIEEAAARAPADAYIVEVVVETSE